MIQSMTGYGKTIVQLPQKKVTIEVKSLNSKNLDLNVRIPSIYKEKELEIRKFLSKNLVRGKVECSIFIEVTGEETTTKINKEVVNSYIDQLRNIAVTSPENTLEIAMRLPDSLKVEREQLNEKEWKAIEEGIEETIQEILIYRKDEVKVLKQDFIAKLGFTVKEIWSDPNGLVSALQNSFTQPKRPSAANACASAKSAHRDLCSVNCIDM